MKKSLTFQTVVIAFGKIVVSTSSLGSGMLLSRYLSLEDYGTYRQVLLIYNLLFPFLPQEYLIVLITICPSWPRRNKKPFFVRPILF